MKGSVASKCSPYLPRVMSQTTVLRPSLTSSLVYNTSHPRSNLLSLQASLPLVDPHHQSHPSTRLLPAHSIPLPALPCPATTYPPIRHPATLRSRHYSTAQPAAIHPALCPVRVAGRPTHQPTDRPTVPSRASSKQETDKQAAARNTHFDAAVCQTTACACRPAVPVSAPPRRFPRHCGIAAWLAASVD